MKYFSYIIIIMLCVTSYGAMGQTQYKSHTVQKGETVSSISRLYKIKPVDIYKLNPNAVSGLQENDVLVIPSEAFVSTGTAKMKFKTHKVRRKETLYSIAIKYGVEQDDIKKYNKELYSRQLKKGEKIQIPMGFETTSSVAVNPKDKNVIGTDPAAKQHIVQPKETKYGIARMYGVTIAELEALNPGMGDGLQIGMTLNVPNTSVTESATIEDEEYDFYEVKKQEGFYRLKVNLGLSEEEIIQLNPYAKDGLKEGMILKIPKQSSSVSISGSVEPVNLESMIINRDQKRIAVLLPFQLQKAVGDSTETNVDLIRENGIMRVALDFHSGILMAAEFAKDKGISTRIDVYDTQGSAGKVSSIISGNNIKDADAVIGPLLGKNVEQAALDLRSSKTPVFSPLSNKTVKMSSNLFQTLPSDEMLKRGMIEYLQRNEMGKNFIIISDVEHAKSKSEILAIFPNAKSAMPRAKGFLYETDIASKIEKGKDNWVILASADPVIVSNVVNLLHGMPDGFKLRLFTLDKNDAFDFDDISNRNLAKLSFTFPSVNKSYNYKDKDAFLISYKNKYGVLPNRYAVRGFDITYDVLLRLASADNIYDASDTDYETEYVENKFRYSKKMFSGYQNNAMYIIKYTPTLQFEVVK